MGFPTKNDYFGVFGGYHHLRKHLYELFDLFATNETLELAAIDSSLEKSAVPEINQTRSSLSKIFFSGLEFVCFHIHPGKINMEPENTCLKRKLIFQTSIFGFHGILSTTLSNALNKITNHLIIKAIKHSTVQAI